jgi:phosphoribosylamine--glycine ligase/phosphoribosylformylglycinamidine cyclo-ligase
LFEFVESLVSLEVDELYRTLNMGIGMVLVVAPENAQDIQALIAEETWVIGVLDTQTPNSPQVVLR